MTKPAYTGFLLDSNSIQICKNIFEENNIIPELLSKNIGISLVESLLILENFVLKSHHVTLNMGSCPEQYLQFIGKRFQFKITGIGIDDKVAGISVEILNSDFKFKNKTPHCTLAVNTTNGGKPFMSNQLEFVKFKSELILTTELFEFNSDSSIF